MTPSAPDTVMWVRNPAMRSPRNGHCAPAADPARSIPQEGRAMTNQDIARRLREQAAELARGGNNLYRIRAFRQAAMAVLGLSGEAADLVARSGPRVLEGVPGIGKSLAGTIAGLAADPLAAACGHFG